MRPRCRRFAAIVLLPGALTAQAVQPPALAPLATLPGAGPVTFAEVQGAVSLADGGVLVLDLGNRTLYRFNAAGRFVDSLGRRGRGPGEFQLPVGVVTTRDGGLGILDITLRALFWWSARGGHQSQVSLPADWAPMDLRHGADNMAWIKAQRFRDNQLVFSRVAASGAVIDSGILITTPAGASGGGSPGPTCTFCPWTPWPGGGVVVAAGDTAYALTHLGPDGQPGKVWSRRVPARRRSAEELRALAGLLRRGPGGGAATPEAGGTAAPTVSPWAPRVASLGVDGRGRLWALVHHGGETQAVLDVFAADGAYLVTVRPSPGAQRMRVAGDRLLVWGVDASDEPAVWVYRIER